MKPLRSSVTFASCLALGIAVVANAGAPAPDQREDDFVHVCRSGPNVGDSCNPATEAADCGNSDCVLVAKSSLIKGTLTLIAHDSVTDWSSGQSGNRAVTLMLEVRAPDGSQQMLAATYQNLPDPTQPPTAPGNVIAIAMDEAALAEAARAVGGFMFTTPESTLAKRLQTLFGNTGTPAIVSATDRQVQFADHTGDGLATVVRFKVKLQFLEPAS